MQAGLSGRAPVARDVLVGRTPDILDDIGLPGVAAVIWKRDPVNAFRTWLAGLADEHLPVLRTVVPVHLVEAAVITACENYRTPLCVERDMLASDAAARALMFAKVLDIRLVRVRLDVSSEIMCPKFHVDNVAARLLCAYRGGGSEYVSDCAPDDEKRIRALPGGSVGLFRGRTWPGEEATGLLHRSPAMVSGSPARLLLVIDPAE
ncbi:DUF1826 domain-containing protein [Rhodobacterales bacterium]|nr:DUF1826 domain-containing protein [Rhodobacterales bacterium]